jgi:hypothetical protein
MLCCVSSVKQSFKIFHRINVTGTGCLLSASPTPAELFPQAGGKGSCISMQRARLPLDESICPRSSAQVNK